MNQQDHRLQPLTSMEPGGKGVDRVGVEEGEVEEAGGGEAGGEEVGGKGVGMEVGVEEALGVPH